MKSVFIFLFVMISSSRSPAQTLDILNKQINDLWQKGDNKNALTAALKAADITKTKFGERSEQYAQSLLMLANLYNKNGQKNKPESLYLHAMEIMKAAKMGRQTEYIPYLIALASFYVDTRQYGKAEPLYPIAANTLERAGLSNSSLYAALLGSWGNLLYQQGLFAEAKTMFSKAIEIEKNGHLENTPDYTVFTGMLGNIYIREGAFEKAESLLLESMDLRKKLYGEQNPDYGYAVLRLAEFYGEIGQFQKGVDFFIQSIRILGKALGKDHPNFAIVLSKAAAFAYAAGDLTNAQILYKTSMDYVRKAFGEQSKEYGSTINGLALVYLKNKQYTDAKPLFEQAMIISKKLSGENDLDYASSLNNLGLLYSDMGQYEKSTAYFIQALEISKNKLGENHPDYILSLNNLAISYVNTNQYSKAEPLIIAAANSSIQNLRNIFNILSEKEKGDYLENTNWLAQMDNSYLFNIKMNTKELAVSNFNFQLFIKSLSLTDTRSIMELVSSSDDSILKKIFTDWQANRIFLAKQYALPLSKRITGLAGIEVKTEQLEKELTRLSAVFQSQQNGIRISMKDVQKALQADEAAIEFVRFRLHNRIWTDSVIYAAYILRKDDSAPQFVPLCEEKQLGKYFSDATGDITIKTLYRSDPLDENDKPSISGDSLYAMIWKPLIPWLKGIKKIDYSPAGLLYKVAFHALPAGDSLLLMDKFELNQYTSIRQLALTQETSEANGAIALFGDCEYTVDSTEIIKNISANEKTNHLIPPPAEHGNYKGEWKALEGTSNEINGIRFLFGQYKIATSIYSKMNATEEQFKLLSGNSPSILHLATHGFFLPDPEKRKEEGLGADDRNAFTLANDPLLRSGIVLSGANRVWNGQPPIEGREDGILTAYEIAQLDFSKTNLVVLSACQTALGDVKGTEGVFGLQRAFKLAGVKNMLLSLWKVPDAETAELMKIFYTFYLQGKTISESFTAAQKDMRRKYSPFYWAAFVLIE